MVAAQGRPVIIFSGFFGLIETFVSQKKGSVYMSIIKTPVSPKVL
jgi:hypothetical protein